MEKLPIQYYVYKDHKTVYALEEKYGLFAASYNVNQGEWIFSERLNWAILEHDDDIDLYGEVGAMEITGGKSPEELLRKEIENMEKLMGDVDQEIAETEAFFKEYDSNDK